MSNSLFRGSLWLTLSVAGNQILTLVALAVVTRHIEPTTWGIVALPWVLIEFCKNVMTSTSEALIGRPAWDERLADSLHYVFCAVAALFVLLGFSADAVMVTRGVSLEHAVIGALSLSLLFDAPSALLEAHFRQAGEFRKVASRLMISNAAGGLVAVACVVGGLGVWALVFQKLAVSVSQYAFLYLTVKWRPKKIGIQEILFNVKQARHVTVSGIVGQLGSRCPDLIVGAVAGRTALALYQIAGRGVAMLVQLAIIPVQQAALTHFAKFSDSPSSIGEEYCRIVARVSLLTVPIFFGVGAISEEFIGVLFGNEWHAAAPLMFWLSLVVGPVTCLYLLNPALIAAGQAKVLTRMNVSITFVNLAVIFLAAGHGVNVVVQANAVRSTVMLPVSLTFGRKVLKFEIRTVLLGLLPPILAGIIMIAAIHWSRAELMHWAMLPRMVVLIGLGAVVYACAVFALAPKTIFELISIAKSKAKAKFGAVSGR